MDFGNLVGKFLTIPEDSIGGILSGSGLHLKPGDQHEVQPDKSPLRGIEETLARRLLEDGVMIVAPKSPKDSKPSPQITFEMDPKTGVDMESAAS